MERLMDATETRQCKIVFPNTLNDHDTLFGGMAMQWMDEVAYITATRFSRMKLVTVSTGAIKFRDAIKSGMIAEVVGRVISATQAKLEVKVEIFAEEMYSDKKYKAIDSVFTFAAIDDNHKLMRMNHEERLVSRQDFNN